MIEASQEEAREKEEERKERNLYKYRHSVAGFSRFTSVPYPLHCAVLYCIVLYCTVLYCTVRYCTVLYCNADLQRDCTCRFCILRPLEVCRRDESVCPRVRMDGKGRRGPLPRALPLLIYCLWTLLRSTTGLLSSLLLFNFSDPLNSLIYPTTGHRRRGNG